MIRKQWINNITYEPNATKTIMLPRESPIMKMVLRLTGRLSISDGLTDGLPNLENPASLIERITVSGVEGGSSQIIKSINPTTMHVLERFLKGTEPERIQVLSNVGTHDFVQTLTINFVIPDYDFDMGASSTLIAPNFETLNLEVRFRDTAALVTGGDRVLSLTSYGSASGVPSIDIEIHQMDVVDLGEEIDLVVQHRETTISNINTELITTNQRQNLPLGNLYRGIMFRTTDATGSPINDTIRQFTLQQADIILRRHLIPMLRAENKEDYALESLPNGYWFLDFTPENNPEQLLDTEGMAGIGQTLTLVFDALGVAGSELEMHLIEIVELS